MELILLKLEKLNKKKVSPFQFVSEQMKIIKGIIVSVCFGSNEDH